MNETFIEGVNDITALQIISRRAVRVTVGNTQHAETNNERKNI
jgi:hypothetical protein